MIRLFKLFLAWTRLSESAVCEMSKGRPMDEDFHDYPDSDFGYPGHFGTLLCNRCGKEFTI
jgi:hypothetical protein